MRKGLLFGFYMFSVSIGISQSISQFVIGAGGNENEKDGLFVFSSIGESIIGIRESESLLLVEGFLQIEDIVEIIQGLDNPIQVHIKLFPNPTQDQLNLMIESNQSFNSLLQLTDIKGSILQEEYIKHNEEFTSISLDLKGLSGGLYLLHFSQDGSQELRTYRIIKK